MAENNPSVPSSSKSSKTSPAYLSAQYLARLSKSGRAFFVPTIRAFGALLGPLFAILLVMILIAGCSSKSGADDSPSALMLETQNIALAYQAHGDVTLAQADLAKLGMANPEQWLLLTTETAISGGDSQLSAGGTLALAKLTHDLGLRSTAVNAFASQNNLIATKTPAQPLAESSTPALAAAPTVAATPTESQAPALAAAPAAIDPTPVPAETPASSTPKASPQSTLNVRSGPGTAYAVVASVQGGTSVPIVAKNPEGDWWQVQLDNGGTGWLYGPLVEISGETRAVVVAANIPAPPPTNTPAPTAVPQPTATPVPSGPDFRLVERRLWTVEETGGHRDGTSVNCAGGLGLLRVIVLDASGAPLNGVTVKAIGRFNAGSPDGLQATGSKGPGIAEFDMNTDGDDIVVFRDVGEREISSNVAYGNSGRRAAIPFSALIQAGYCADQGQCEQIVQNDPFACQGHFSWTVKFQRNY